VGQCRLLHLAEYDVRTAIIMDQPVSSGATSASKCRALRNDYVKKINNGLANQHNAKVTMPLQPCIFRTI